jgi:AAA domain/Bifunctional DNA primase/polymerase, N-terminal
MPIARDNRYYAEKCAELGMHVFPCGSNKKPRVKWRAESTTDIKQIDAWWTEWPDALPGIDLSKSNHVVIDGDRHGGPDGVAAAEQLFVERQTDISIIPTVITPSGGRHYYFLQPNGEPIGNSDKPLRDKAINIRGSGGYVIAPGAQLPDGSRYTQDKNSPNVFEALLYNTVPVLPPWLATMLRNGHNCTEPNSNGAAAPDTDTARHHAYAQAALDGICDELAATPEGRRNTILNNAAFRMGTMAAQGWIERGDEQALLRAAVACGLPADEILPTLRSGLDAGEKQPHAELKDRPSVIDAKAEQQQHGQGHDAERAPQMTGLGEWDAGELDDSNIPPRGWLLGNVFCRGFVSSLLGDGGVGKTATRYAQFLSLVTGRTLTGEHVFQRCRVLIISLEDDAQELRRRIRAARLHHKIDQQDLKGWLFLATPGASAGKLLTVGKDGKLIVAGLADRIKEAIKKRSIDLVALDPFVKAHGVGENDNTAIDAVAQILTDIAAEYNIGVDVPHHISKGSAEPGNASRGRGASSMKDAWRLVYTLTPMSPEEAQSLGLDDSGRKSLIRMDSGKVNIAPPMTEAKWFRLVGVPIGNGTDLYPAGDTVQTVEPWTPPDKWAGLGSYILLSDIDAGLPDGNRYTHGRNAGDRAAWRVVTKHVPDKSEALAKDVIKAWLATGLLYSEEYENPKTRKPVKGLWVNNTKRPS